MFGGSGGGRWLAWDGEETIRRSFSSNDPVLRTFVLPYHTSVAANTGASSRGTSYLLLLGPAAE